MILCLDCGNTRLKWGLRSGSDWAAMGTLRTDDAGALRSCLPAASSIERAIGCIVASPAACAAIEAVLPLTVDWIKARDTQCGVNNRYDNPAQLGADRWAALIGARGLHHGACIVVSAGTATTIDLLDAAGVFQGGLIMPGLALMHTALASNTARLPHAPGHYRPLPRNTHDAITSGAIYGTLGAIERMFSSIAQEPGALCLLSGGSAESLSNEIALPHLRIDNLALEGLAHIATGMGPTR